MFAPGALLAASALASCGGGDPTAAEGTQLPTAAREVTVPAGAPSVDQDNLYFKPDNLTVKAGEKIYFLNGESALHTVTIDRKNVSGTMKKGDVAVWSAPAAGTYKITCDFHPQMKATLTVE